MARRNKHSLEEIRKMVLNAAETIIINEGYSALTVRRIAMQIGYTVGSIYMVFANMADLVIHIKANTVDDLTEQLQQIPDCAPDRHIKELAKTYLKFAEQNFNRWSMIFVRDDNDPEWYQQKIDLIFSRVETQFAQLKPSCSKQQSQQAARSLWSGVHGICTLSLTGKQNAAGINDVENDIVLLVESFTGGWVASRWKMRYAGWRTIDYSSICYQDTLLNLIIMIDKHRRLNIMIRILAGLTIAFSKHAPHKLLTKFAQNRPHFLNQLVNWIDNEHKTSPLVCEKISDRTYSK